MSDLFAELEAIDKSLNLKSTKPSNFSIEGDAVKSFQWQPRYDPYGTGHNHDTSILDAFRKGLSYTAGGTLTPDDVEKWKNLSQKEGIRFILDVEHFDEYTVDKVGDKITYKLTFNVNAIPADTSHAAGLAGITALADRWKYDSLTVDVDDFAFHATITNLRKKN